MSKKPAAAPTERRRGEGAKFVYEILRDEIIDLTLPPGSPIDEIQLAERLSMSRTPIREALVRLAGDGLVTTLPKPLVRNPARPSRTHKLVANAVQRRLPYIAKRADCILNP